LLLARGIIGRSRCDFEVKDTGKEKT
jgi:hypothetical protein